jgi:hypothetical protein
MPNWSKKAWQQMADLINEHGVSADTAATLRNLINQWADGQGNNHATKTFSEEARLPITATIANGEVLSIVIE